MKSLMVKPMRFVMLLGSLLLIHTLGPLGPAMASVGPFGGNVGPVAVDPSDPRTIYAGTGGGGVFKSTNGGTNWSGVNKGLAAQNILSSHRPQRFDHAL